MAGRGGCGQGTGTALHHICYHHAEVARLRTAAEESTTVPMLWPIRPSSCSARGIVMSRGKGAATATTARPARSSARHAG